MSEKIEISGHTKAEKYDSLYPQIVGLLDGETDQIAALSNVIAALHHGMEFFWTGFYRKSSTNLVLGPFQGPVACSSIGFGRGVCGACYQSKQTIIVPDVEKFEGHIACSSLSRSEIVVPLFYQNQVMFVLDIDSVDLFTFDEIDQQNLEKIMQLLEQKGFSTPF